MEILNHWLQNLIAYRELGKAEGAIRSRDYVERAYILLYIATLREMLRQESELYFNGLDMPEKLTRRETKDLFYYFRNMRDASERKLQEIDGMLERAEISMPKEERLHMIYSIDSLNILLGTLARGLLGNKIDGRCRDLWLELERSHSSLEKAMNKFQTATKTAGPGGTNLNPSIPFSDMDSWLSSARWLPKFCNIENAEN